MQSLEINDLFEHESPVGQLFVKLKELGIAVEREWWIDEEGIAYVVDLALPVGMAGCRSALGSARPLSNGLRFATQDEPNVCLQELPGQTAGVVTRIAPERAETLPHRADYLQSESCQDSGYSS